MAFERTVHWPAVAALRQSSTQSAKASCTSVGSTSRRGPAAKSPDGIVVGRMAGRRPQGRESPEAAGRSRCRTPSSPRKRRHCTGPPTAPARSSRQAGARSGVAPGPATNPTSRDPGISQEPTHPRQRSWGQRGPCRDTRPTAAGPVVRGWRSAVGDGPGTGRIRGLDRCRLLRAWQCRRKALPPSTAHPLGGPVGRWTASALAAAP